MAKIELGDNFILRESDSGNFELVYEPTGEVVSFDGTALASSLLDGDELNIGSSTEIFESNAGSTVLRNADGNPINIQLYPSGRAYMTENSTTTTISEQNTWYPIEGVWDIAHANFLSLGANGGLIYDGDVETQVNYQVNGVYESPSSNATYEIAMFKDGAVKSRTIIPFSPPRQEEVLSLPALNGFTDSTTSGMEHDVRVRCTTGTDDITFPSLSFTLKG